MAIFTYLASVLLQSVHGTAFLVGGIVYLGYISLMVPAVPTQRSKDSQEEQPQSLRSALASRVPAMLWALFFVMLAVYLMLPSAQPAGNCPVESFLEEEPLYKPTTAEAPVMEGLSPLSLLEAAHVATDGGDDETGRVHLEACIAWHPAADETVSLAVLHAQLECHGERLEMGVSTRRESAAIASSAWRVVRAATEKLEEDRNMFTDIQVEWARIAHGCLRSHFNLATEAVRAQRNSAPQGKAGLAALEAVGSVGIPFKRSIAATELAVVSLGPFREKGTEEKEELQNLLSSARVSILNLVREARALVSEIRTSPADVKVLKQLECPVEALAKVEVHAVAEAEIEAKQNTHFGGQAQFALGEYWSERVVEKGAESASQDGWALDASGTYVPKGLLQAEEFLAAGAEAAIDDKAEKTEMRALRLYHHAKMLAKLHHDAAAEWRYRDAAVISLQFKRKKLAAHVLSRLGYLYVQRGRHQEALDALNQADAQGGNALTTYLRTTLLRKSGKLQSVEELRASDDALGEVAGQLPSKGLEEQRKALHVQVTFWRSAMEGSAWLCFNAQDVAHILICLFCKALFPPEPARAALPPSENSDATPAVSAKPSTPIKRHRRKWGAIR